MPMVGKKNLRTQKKVRWQLKSMPRKKAKK